MDRRTYGPVFRWFAWHPVDTEDRGWRWLRMVSRRRVAVAESVMTNGYRYFETWVD